MKSNVADSLIGGLMSHDDELDLAWLSSNDAFKNGSLIKSVNIEGTLISSAGSGMPYAIGAYELGE